MVYCSPFLETKNPKKHSEKNDSIVFIKLRDTYFNRM